jgi:hypothetical protein
MNENTITIALDEYKELIAKAERIETVGRMLGTLNYVNVDDIRAVLGIEPTASEES